MSLRDGDCLLALGEKVGVVRGYLLDNRDGHKRAHIGDRAPPETLHPHKEVAEHEAEVNDEEQGSPTISGPSAVTSRRS